MVDMKIPYKQLNIIWISKYHEYPIEGLCRQDGELKRFLIDDNDYLYEIHTLSKWEKVKWTYRRIEDGARKNLSKMRN